MLTNDREKAICDKYSALDETKHVHCNECPLNLADKTGGEIACKATHHYNRHTREWEPDWLSEEGE